MYKHQHLFETLLVLCKIANNKKYTKIINENGKAIGQKKRMDVGGIWVK